MRRRLWLLCLALVVLVPLPAMSFCEVPQPRLVCAEYFKAQLVVEATLVQTSELHDKDDPEGISAYVYTLMVNRVLRGRAVGSIRVNEGNDSGRSTFAWTPGREYLLFLFYSAPDKAWALDGCGNSGPLSQSNKALSEIDAIKAARGGGAIYGVVSLQGLVTPIPGVHIEAQGSQGHYAATTDAKGAFKMDVPAGQYSVRAVQRGRSLRTALFSYEDRLRTRVQTGGCAQIQFVEPSP